MDHITIRRAPGRWVVRAAGAVLGETTKALELSEGHFAPVIYFPRGDIAMAFLEKTETSTTCPHKGAASYYSIITAEGAIRDAAWSYEAPKDGAGEIAGHLAFYPDRATVERV
jgi:uncharacterized protein (DUF427 family)